MIRLIILVNILQFLIYHTLADPVVQTVNGNVRGTTDLSQNNKTIFVFRGIPYGKPPLGNLRFQAPQEANNWDGVLNATNEVICVQLLAFYESPAETEDCLSLNVYTPQLPRKNRPLLPVMFYIFGGGFTFGNATYDQIGPQFLIDYDVVIVTINYRLGAFGFLSTHDLVIPGNAGLKDQQLALKWVNKNIAKFGGDPRKVTIFGHSAGSSAVSFQVLSPTSSGLFRGAIQQSGSALSPWTLQRNPKSIVYRTAAALNYKGTRKSSEMLQFLQEKSTKEIRTAALQIVTETSTVYEEIHGFAYAPVIEVHKSNSAFITEKMYELFKSGRFNQVPTMMGLMNAEYISIAANLTEYKQVLKIFDDNSSILVPTDIYYNPKNKDILTRLVKDIYVPNTTFEDTLNSAVMYFDDDSYFKPVRKQAELQSKFTDVYFYQFSFAGSITGEPRVSLPDYGSVGHGEEVSYLWKIRNPGYSNEDLTKYSKRDLLTHNRLVLLWTNFAKYLRPIVSEVDLLQNIRWPCFTKRDTVYLDINDDLTLKHDLRNKRLSQWEYLYKHYGSGNFDTY